MVSSGRLFPAPLVERAGSRETARDRPMLGRLPSLGDRGSGALISAAAPRRSSGQPLPVPAAAVCRVSPVIGSALLDGRTARRASALRRAAAAAAYGGGGLTLLS